MDRVQEAELVDDPADVLEQLADHLAALAPGRNAYGEASSFLALADLLVVVLLELRLVVERVEVRDPARHEEDDQVLRPRREVARPGCEGMARIHRGGDREPAIEAQPAGRGERPARGEERDLRFSVSGRHGRGSPESVRSSGHRNQST